MQAASRYVQRGFRKARGKVIKRYFKKGYRPKIGRMVKDIRKVKSMLNAEKKQYLASLTGQLCGQVNVNGTGAIAIDITPIPAQGTTDVTRTGDSIKLCSAYLRFQFLEQGAFPGMARYRVTILKILGTPQTPSTILANYYRADPISTVIDFNSVVNTDFFGQYKKVCERTFQFKSFYNTDTFQATKVIKLRLNHHVRFSNNSTTVSDGQYVMLVTADCGNASGGANSTLTNIPAQAINTGVNMCTNFVWYYYDN